MAGQQENMVVWNRPQFELAASLIAMALGFFLNFLQLQQSLPGTGQDLGVMLLMVVGIPLLMLGMAVAVLVASLKSRYLPVLILEDAALYCCRDNIRIPWPLISQLGIKHSRLKSGKINPRQFDLNISYAESPGAPQQKALKASLNYPSVSSGQLEAALHSRWRQPPQARAILLPTHTATVFSRKGQAGDIAVLLWLGLAAGLALCGVENPYIGSTDWDGFHLQPLADVTLAWLGCAEGLLLFLICVPAWQRAMNHTEHTSGIAPIHLLFLPLFVGAFGYLPATRALPMLGNWCVGAPYSTHFAVSGKDYIPRHGKHGSCYSLSINEVDGSGAGSICVTHSSYNSTQIGNSYLLSGRESWFGTQLTDYRADPAYDAAHRSNPAPDSSATPAVVATAAPQPTAATAEATATTGGDDPRLNYLALRTVCVQLTAADRAEHSLQSHMKMAQACVKAGMPYD